MNPLQEQCVPLTAELALQSHLSFGHSFSSQTWEFTDWTGLADPQISGIFLSLDYIKLKPSYLCAILPSEPSPWHLERFFYPAIE